MVRAWGVLCFQGRILRELWEKIDVEGMNKNVLKPGISEGIRGRLIPEPVATLFPVFTVKPSELRHV